MGKETESATSNKTASDVSSHEAFNPKDMILTLRGMQVLLDTDVAKLYGYETKYINRAANRNIERFPETFRFELSQSEFNEVSRCHFGTLKVQQGKNMKYLPYAYTEQGIAMLSSLLKNGTAVRVSINIMSAFVEMRKILTGYGNTFDRIANIEQKQLTYDKNFDIIFDKLQEPDIPPQRIFYKGQMYDAFKWLIDILKTAKSSVTIIDNYADSSVLETLSKCMSGLKFSIFTTNPNKIDIQHLQKFSEQFGVINIIKTKDFHDRYVIVDEKEVYLFGASLKDLGKKCFSVVKLEDSKEFVQYFCWLLD
ncbi:hypothetical protein FACS1894125_6120 [Actinomycetota bacterium]|nr:hypothetical protein FACS1894125_6120 [Actinomycetota bacterium]